MVVRIERLRRDRKYSACRIASELAAEGITVSVRTVGQHLVHLDVKKVGVIPDGGDRRVHGRVSEQAKQVECAKNTTERQRSYTYLHSTDALQVWNVHHNHHRPHTTA